MGRRWILFFEEGHAGMRDLLGGKGANLAEMTRAGLPVPPGFTVTTEACRAYLESGRFPPGLEEELSQAMAELEQRTGKRFGDPGNPLLVSVRSGAPVSMPGMMDTILNLGLNDATVEGLAAQSGDPRFAYDCYRRLVQMFGEVVLGAPKEAFQRLLEEARLRAGAPSEAALDAPTLRELVRAFLDRVRQETGTDFPQDPHQQLRLAVAAVFRSWHNPRAQVYRRLHRIPDDLGTAVTVQAMVFGNLGEDSGTGVVFTRNPNTGAPELYGEYLPNAQGEDVVAGIRTPLPVAALQERQPEVYAQLAQLARRLERHYRDMQDIEFTVERGRLYVLQTRSGKRTAAAAVRIAHDLAAEGVITREEALLRVEPAHVEQLLHRTVDPSRAPEPAARGLPASPGAATGIVVFDPDEAEARGKRGEAVILVRPETSPDDIHGIAAAAGVLTSRGGLTSHAAVVTRGLGKPCVVGCEALVVDLERGEARLGSAPLRPGDRLTLDGSTGYVYLGEVPLVEPQLMPEFRTLLQWADAVRRLGVRANADTPEDARRARQLGAEGIGLVRTEHMFLGPERLPLIQAAIMAAAPEEREQALARLLPLQRQDFKAILREMDGLPVTIRLLDPPLHEFLPDPEELGQRIEQLRQEGGDPAEVARLEALRARARALREANPMLGHRGCRLGITWPELYEMQVRAILEAAAELAREGGDPRPEIMLPLVSTGQEQERLRQRIEAVWAQVCRETGAALPLSVGACIEVPRACLVADEIARAAEFFSFGTNDLTQTTFGFSRDDAEAKFLHVYLEQRLLPENPFVALDRAGVGRLMEMAVRQGRSVRPDLKVGICGEQAGEPASIAFCDAIGLDYVSVSPFRVPLARLAAAQAAVRARGLAEVTGEP